MFEGNKCIRCGVSLEEFYNSYKIKTDHEEDKALRKYSINSDGTISYERSKVKAIR
ncbi:hypothetical protein MTBBW1_2000003 [Desulfamplus magnetovallimortis]|uniref:Uncharacterized protein n=1 Tax=Desulfamplus magnetovallimortis TaxID=1246637 RepID=A0A1W1HBS3_9BACT|nr:hypothetical protein MTBBW1_2000003 [Desulfamplus magnetovallimortis]